MIKSFIEHTTEIEELNVRGLIQRGLKKAKALFKKVFSKINFGQKVRIPVSLPKIIQENIDAKSRLGYFSEIVTAVELAKNIVASGGHLGIRTKLDALKRQLKDDEAVLKRELNAKDAKDIKRQMAAGKAMADAIFADVQAAEDYKFLEFEIELTGDSGKGTTKADMVLTVTKKNEKEVIDEIHASLKSYKTNNINLANNTYISFFKTLFYDKGTAATSSAEFIEQFAKDFGSRNQVRRLIELQNIIPTLMKAGKTKEEARKVAKESHPEVIEIIVEIFDTYYQTHKKVLNDRMLFLLGLDSSDDFYASIGKDASKQKVISSRMSKKMKELLDNVKKDFSLSIRRNPGTSNANIEFLSPDGSPFFSGNITFTDTGGASAQGKSNAFFNFKGFEE
jgi:hypothetical protein